MRPGTLLLLTALGSPAWGETLCIGHLNPDTDSIGSAIGASELFDCTPARQGELNRESEFVLEYFEVTPPELIEEYKDQQLILLDHNERSQHQPGLNQEKVIRIIDHHAIGDSVVKSSRVIPVDIRPLGSTSTILAQYFQETGRTPSARGAGMMLSAIVSDTLIFTSPTSTEQDREAASWLAPIAGVEDVEAFGELMLQAKSDISHLSDRELLLSDFKEYDIADHRIGFGSIETLYPNSVLARQDGLLRAMTALKRGADYDFLFLSIVDIKRGNTYLMCTSEGEAQLARLIYTGDERNNGMFLAGQVSRKKQFIPPLIEYLNQGETHENG